MIFYTSDLHFGHENVIRFDNRPFRSVSEMDYTLIHLWNSRVQPDDTAVSYTHLTLPTTPYV